MQAEVGELGCSKGGRRGEGEARVSQAWVVGGRGRWEGLAASLVGWWLVIVDLGVGGRSGARLVPSFACYHKLLLPPQLPYKQLLPLQLTYKLLLLLLACKLLLLLLLLLAYMWLHVVQVSTQVLVPRCRPHHP